MGIGSANEMRRYSVTLALIGRAHVQKDLWIIMYLKCISRLG